jgi:serine/threonine protein kinase
MLKNEMKTIRMLDSEYFVKLQETYEGKKELIMVMEYLEGGSLYMKLKLHKSLSEK